MNFNTILYRFGVNPDCFVNEENEPIRTPEGFIYEVRQRTDIRICPHCSSHDASIQGYRHVEINCSETGHIKDIMRIRKVRFKCRNCGKTYTPQIEGINPYSKTSEQTISLIVKDFFKMITFHDIGTRYGLSTPRIIQIFDAKVPFVPRRSLPEVLCIDEIRFSEDISQKYCCVLYDFFESKITDIIKNRQLPYLDEYFTGIKENERKHVKYFVSDMYDGYRTVKKRYFPGALHIVDLFHVIVQLTNAVNRLRINAMNRYSENSVNYRFMKAHWKCFLSRKENIPDRFYTSRKTGECFHYDDLVFDCVLKDKDLLEGYNALQDIYHYNEKYFTFNEAHSFVCNMAERLILSGNELLESVGYTYRKWAVEIANGIAKSQSGRHYTNGIAESINNKLKTIIKVSYGYHNFDRFRRRAMLIGAYKKEPE